MDATTQKISSILAGVGIAVGLGALLDATALAQAPSAAAAPDPAATQNSERRQRDPAEEFALADFNQDGCISWEEMRNRTMIVFGGLDANKDGKLTPDELFHLVDDPTEVQKDVSIALSTLQAAVRESFEKEDADGSGCIDKSEWT